VARSPKITFALSGYTALNQPTLFIHIYALRALVVNPKNLRPSM